MFEQKHIDQIRKISESHIQKMIFFRTETLENAYKENPLVKNAEISVDGETVNIDVKLNINLKDDEQNIPLVLEMGGVIIDADDKVHEVEPGWYIRSIMAYGT